MSFCTARRGFYVAVVVTLVFGLDSVARAECGDYVIVGRPNGSHEQLLPGFKLPLGALTKLASHGEEKLPGKLPCHGPSCRSGSPVPPMPVPVQTVSVTHWAISSAPVRLPFLPHSDVRASAIRFPIDPCSDPIEHPPRPF